MLIRPFSHPQLGLIVLVFSTCLMGCKPSSVSEHPVGAVKPNSEPQTQLSVSERPFVPVKSNSEPKAQLYESERYLPSFRAHLAEQYPQGKWKQGPEGIDSPELRQAYPGSQFYYVASPEPLPRGSKAASKTMSKGGANETASLRLSLCARFGPEGRLTELRRSEDYNEGLSPIRSDRDARYAAAAILSTMNGDYFGPSVISSSLVEVEKVQDGWKCRLQTRTKQGRVFFSDEGKCISTTLVYVGPFPP